MLYYSNGASARPTQRYKRGDRVVVQNRNLGPITVEIDEWEDDVKNGVPGISYRYRGESWWAYDHQILRKA
jgi:hypothetical protein